MKRGFPGIPVLGLAAIALLASCSSSTVEAPPPPVGAFDQMQPLAPGDAIRIGSWREPDMSGEFQIDENGQVVLPMLGRVQAAGVDPDTLRQRVFEGYSAQLVNPDIEITLLRRVSILGGVTTPGLYLLDPTMRLADAVALAGGASGSGDIAKTQVRRSGQDVTAYVSMTAPLMNQLVSGDQIYVPEKSWLERNGIVLMATLISATAIIYAATIR